MPVADGKLLISTSDINVYCSQPYYDKCRLEPCAQEEADTRLLLHASDNSLCRLHQAANPNS